VSVAPKTANPGAPDEATLLNNRRVLVVNRGQGPYRILYVAGRPNWEYQSLNRAVESDDQVQLVGLIRVAKREPKFDFRGRAGETQQPAIPWVSRSGGRRGAALRPAGAGAVELPRETMSNCAPGFPRTPEGATTVITPVVIDELGERVFRRRTRRSYSRKSFRSAAAAF